MAPFQPALVASRQSQASRRSTSCSDGTALLRKAILCQAIVSYKEVLAAPSGPSLAVEVYPTEEAVGARMCEVRSPATCSDSGGWCTMQFRPQS